jgi:hypothetical protein
MIWDAGVPRYSVTEVQQRLRIDFVTLKEMVAALRRAGQIHGKKFKVPNAAHWPYHYTEEEIQTIWETYRRNVMTEKYWKEENIAYHKRAYANHQRRAENYASHLRPRAHSERPPRDHLPGRADRHPRQLPEDQ